LKDSKKTIVFVGDTFFYGLTGAPTAYDAPKELEALMEKFAKETAVKVAEEEEKKEKEDAENERNACRCETLGGSAARRSYGSPGAASTGHAALDGHGSGGQPEGPRFR